jgi:hypothetical protein
MGREGVTRKRNDDDNCKERHKILAYHGKARLMKVGSHNIMN